MRWHLSVFNFTQLLSNQQTTNAESCSKHRHDVKYHLQSYEHQYLFRPTLKNCLFSITRITKKVTQVAGNIFFTLLPLP